MTLIRRAHPGLPDRPTWNAIKRDHTYVSRRLRVFEDPVLAPLVLKRKLPVSTAEELLRTPDAAARKDLAMRAAECEWTVGEARKAISEIGANRTKVADLLICVERSRTRPTSNQRV